MKHCNYCGLDKEDDLFNYKNKGKNIRRSICSECSKLYGRNHYNNHKNDYAERNKKNKIKSRDKYKEYKEHLFCLVCGERETCCLDFHHINPEEKDNNIPNIIDQERSWKKALKEIEKCVVLCSNCHRKLHAGLIELPL